MKRSFIAIACAGAALTACATTPSTHLGEGKALADAWSAFDAASTTLDGLATQGVLTAPEKATLRTVLPEVKTALESATSAYDANNDATAEQNVATATTLIAQLVAIVKVHQ